MKNNSGMAFASVNTIGHLFIIHSLWRSGYTTITILKWTDWSAPRLDLKPVEHLWDNANSVPENVLIQYAITLKYAPS